MSVIRIRERLVSPVHSRVTLLEDSGLTAWPGGKGEKGAIAISIIRREGESLKISSKMV